MEIRKLYASRQKLTFLKTLLCTLVIGGVILVVQPTFIFGSDQIEMLKKNSLNQTDTKITPMPHENEKTIGVIISLICALSAGFLHVSAAKTNKQVSRVSLMIAGGVGTYFLTMIGYLLTKDTASATLAKVTLFERAGLTVAVATASIIAGHLLVIANQVIQKYNCKSLNTSLFQNSVLKI